MNVADQQQQQQRTTTKTNQNNNNKQQQKVPSANQNVSISVETFGKLKALVITVSKRIFIEKKVAIP